MSSTTPGSEPSRRDDEAIDADDGARVEASEPVEPDEPVAARDGADSGVDPAGAPAHAERIERVEAAEVPPPVTEPTPHGDVAFTGTDAAAADFADEDAAARLDAAVERANADAAASAPTAPVTDADAYGDAYPEPVPADSVRRDTYVPAATVAAGTAAGAATLAPEPTETTVVAPTPPQAIYVQAPNPPKTRGNRGFGILVGLVATLAFAVLYAAVAFLLVTGFGAGTADGVRVYTEFLARPVFWVPIAAFFLAFMVLAAILNTAAWWTWAVFGLFVGVVVYFAYIGGALLTVEAWRLTFEEAQDFIAQRWLDPFAIAAAIIARELPIWFGGWIAAHGRTVAERNREAREEYDRQIAAGPQVRQY